MINISNLKEASFLKILP